MDNGLLLITLGALFLAGLFADQLGRLTRLPRVTLLLIVGLLAGKSGFGVIPEAMYHWFEVIAIVALTMVAFLLGGELTQRNLSRHGRAIMAISITVVVTTMVMVWAGLTMLGLDPRLALVLGAIATTTAPEAISDVIHQSGAQNGFTRTLAGIVATDDIWGLVVFGLCLSLIGHSDGWSAPLVHAGYDLGGAVLLGVAIGLPAAFLTGRLKPGEPLRTEALGVVLLTAGLAMWLEFSFLIAGMTAGALVANLAGHHSRAIHEIQHIEWPFVLLFFLLAGASLEIGVLKTLGWLSGGYIALRALSRLIGAEVGARLSGVKGVERHVYGPALLPQAGVALGMALVAAEALPDHAATILAMTIAATVVFELIGPPFTLFAIRRVASASRSARRSGGRRNRGFLKGGMGRGQPGDRNPEG